MKPSWLDYFVPSLRWWGFSALKNGTGWWLSLVCRSFMQLHCHTIAVSFLQRSEWAMIGISLKGKYRGLVWAQWAAVTPWLLWNHHRTSKVAWRRQGEFPLSSHTAAVFPSLSGYFLSLLQKGEEQIFFPCYLGWFKGRPACKHCALWSRRESINVHMVKNC